MSDRRGIDAARPAAGGARLAGLAFACGLALGLAAAARGEYAPAPGGGPPARPGVAQGEAEAPRERLLEGPIDPAQYRLGPGDLLNLRIGLQPPVDRTLRVSPEGFLILPEGPSVAVAGIPVVDAEKNVAAVLSRYYKEGKVSLHLLELRTFGVFVVGEVERVGMVEATAVDRVSELITRAGGLKSGSSGAGGGGGPGEAGQIASTRGILLTRASGEVLRVDLGLFDASGALLNNPVVEAGDRIYVPPLTRKATVSGAVRKPGEIEVVEGDSVATAIALSHGLREDALEDSAYVESFEGSPTRSHRHYMDLRTAEARRYPIHERDLIFVRPRPNWTATRTVLVKGEVRFPGIHALPADSLPLSRVIEMAGGFTGMASLREAYVTRKQEELPTDPEFERLSKLPTAEMTPDEFEYYSLKLRTQKPVVSVDFVALFLHGDRKHDINVHSGDEIVVPRIQPYVTVVGEVARPGNIPFEPEMAAEQYIERSGGYTWRAAKGRVAVIRALTGEWAEKGNVQRLGPGDTIWVPRKPRRNLWRGALDTIGLISQLATVYLVIDNAVNR